jgi:hypothetical protein
VVVCLLAALLASLLPSWAAETEGIFFLWRMILPFTLVGSFAVLLPAYAGLRLRGLSRRECYAATVGIGVGVGSLMLLPISDAFGGVATGAFFGGLTAIIWVGLHWATGPLISRFVKERNDG